MARNDYSIYNEVMSIKASKRNWELIVLVKNGEYYEAYEEDADQVSGICKIGQFNRKGSLLNIAGFHKSTLSDNLPKLIRAGWKVAILDK
jgi:DNA mismatch repair ATPase MutS